METLVEFVLGNGYYEDPEKSIFEDMNIDRLKLDFDRLNVCPHPLPTDFHTQALYNDYFEDVELVWKIPHAILPLPHINYTIKFTDLRNIFKCVKKNSEDPSDFIRRFSIFVRVFSDNCMSMTMTIARLIPVGIDYYELDNYDGITLRCYAYNMHRWFEDSSLISANSSDIWDQREIMLKSEMGISDAKYNELSRYGDDIMNFTPTYIHDTNQFMESQEFLCDIPTRLEPIIPKINKNLEKHLIKFNGRLINIFDISKAPLELSGLSGDTAMSILDKLPKIKRLERNGAFTTAVWEDGTITKVKKSDHDEDDFEKLVFFLILKKLCDNNTHKVHSTLTDYLNTFRDATVDIPKQKEEKAEKKRKAKERKENE